MPAPRIRSEYDELEQIVKMFLSRSEQTDQSLKRLTNQMETLRGGDWVGQGAKKFCSEMDSSLIPSMQNLSNGLEEGGKVTKKIIQIMRQADEDAAKLIKAPDAAEGLVGAGIAAGAQAGAQAAAKAAAGSKISDATSKAVDRVLAKYDPKVRALVKQSPTLAKQIQSLEGKVKFKYGPKGSKAGYFNGKEIVIGPGESINDQVSSIAHEVGHAKYGKVPYHHWKKGMTKSDYIRKNVDEQMRGEGYAQLNAATARAEIKAAGGPTLGMPGGQDAKYLGVYDKYSKGTITQKQAINQMATLMGNEKTSTNNKPYKDYYGSTYENHWNKHVGKGKTKL